MYEIQYYLVLLKTIPDVQKTIANFLFKISIVFLLSATKFPSYLEKCRKCYFVKLSDLTQTLK